MKKHNICPQGMSYSYCNPQSWSPYLSILRQPSILIPICIYLTATLNPDPHIYLSYCNPQSWSPYLSILLQPSILIPIFIYLTAALNPDPHIYLSYGNPQSWSPYNTFINEAVIGLVLILLGTLWVFLGITLRTALLHTGRHRNRSHNDSLCTCCEKIARCFHPDRYTHHCDSNIWSCHKIRRQCIHLPEQLL